MAGRPTAGDFAARSFAAASTAAAKKSPPAAAPPNGIARGPNGDIFFADNQGEWIPANKIAHVEKGRFYGHPETKADFLPKGQYPDGRTACWLPYNRVKSAAALVCDETGGKFGPFAGQMFVGDVGYGNNTGIMALALEKVDGRYQGACFRFLDGKPNGPSTWPSPPEAACTSPA